MRQIGTRGGSLRNGRSGKYGLGIGRSPTNQPTLFATDDTAALRALVVEPDPVPLQDRELGALPVRQIAVAPTPRRFVEVAPRVRLRNVMPSAVIRALEQRMEALGRVGVHVPTSVFLLLVVDA